MKKINLKGISEILSEKEMKNVMGGSGTCGWYTSQGGVTYYDCGVSQSDAQHYASLGSGGHWCCDSCSSTWYCG